MCPGGSSLSQGGDGRWGARNLKRKQQQPENLENVSDARSSGKKWGVRGRRREVGTRPWVAAMGGQGLSGRAGESGGAAVPICQPLLSSNGSWKTSDPGLVRVPALGPAWHPQHRDQRQNCGVQDVMSRWGGGSWEARGWDPRPPSCYHLHRLHPLRPSAFWGLVSPVWVLAGHHSGEGRACCLVGLVPGNSLESQLSQPPG